MQEVSNGQDDIIGTDVNDDADRQAAQQTILASLNSVFGQAQAGKYNINAGGAAALADRLREPLQRAHVALSEPQLQELSKAILGFRDTPPRSGLIRDLNDLKSVSGVTPQVLAVLQQETYPAPFTILNTEFVGPKVGADLQRKAVLAVPVCARRNAGLHRVPLRMDLRRGRGDRGIPRHDHHDRPLLALQQGDLADRGGGAC